MADAPVAPQVFDFIDTFSDQSSIWSVASTTPLDPQANVLAFCENFFVQFFEAEMETEITSFSSVSAQRAGLLRRRSSTTPAQRKLIRDFQHVCKSHADLVGESYGSGSDERAEFFFAVMPNLLADIRNWAESAGHAEVARRVSVSRGKYEKFLSEAPPFDHD